MKDTDSPLVSIIIPAFNAARFIRATLESVQAQTYTNWEALVVDDCSQDNTYEIVKELANIDNRIRCFQLTENSGPAIARNTAIATATGRYIAFLDSDDLWLPQKLDRQLLFMQAYDIAFSYTQYRRISESGDTCSKLISVPDQIQYWNLLKNTAVTTSTVVIDRKKTGLFEMVNKGYDDFILWLYLLKSGFTAFGLQEDLCRYRIVNNSISRNKLTAARWVWSIYRQTEKISPPLALWCFVNYAWRGYWKNKEY